MNHRNLQSNVYRMAGTTFQNSGEISLLNCLVKKKITVYFTITKTSFLLRQLS